MGDLFPFLILSCLAALGLIFLSGLLIRPAAYYVQMNAEGFQDNEFIKTTRFSFLFVLPFLYSGNLILRSGH